MLRVKVEAGQLGQSVDAAPLRAAVAADSFATFGEPVAFDPAEESRAALERPAGGLCSLPVDY